MKEKFLSLAGSCFKKNSLPVLDGILQKEGSCYISNLDYTFILHRPLFPSDGVFNLFGKLVNDVDEYPEIPIPILENPFALSKDTLLMMEKALQFVSKDYSHGPVFHSVWLKNKHVVSCDSHTMFKCKAKDVLPDTDLAIPADFLRCLFRFNGLSPLTLYFTEKEVVFTSTFFTAIGRRFEGNVPNFWSIFLDLNLYNTKIEFPFPEIKKAMDRYKSCCGTRTFLRLYFNLDVLTVDLTNSDDFSVSFPIALSPSRIIDTSFFVRHCDSDNPDVLIVDPSRLTSGIIFFHDTSHGFFNPLPEKWVFRLVPSTIR